MEIIIEGEIQSFWFDDITIKNYETGEIIAKAGFEPAEEEEDSKPVIEYTSVTGIYENLRNSETYTEEEMVKVRGAFQFMPVYRAEGITVDGSPEDWEGFPSMTLPTLATQYMVYINDDKPRDVYSEAKFAFDDENLYIYIEVTDDTFVSYQGENDSITFKGTVGNSLLFSVVDAWYTYDVDGMPVLNETHLTVIIDIEISSINTYTDNILVDFGAEKPEKFAVMFEFIEDSKNRIYTVINENSKVVLTVIGYDVEIIYSDESIALLKFMTEDGEQCYLVDNTNPYDYEDTPPEYKPEDEYNPEDKDEGDEDDEGDDGDDDGKDDGGDEYNPDEGDDEDEGGKY